MLVPKLRDWAKIGFRVGKDWPPRQGHPRLRYTFTYGEASVLLLYSALLNVGEKLKVTNRTQLSNPSGSKREPKCFFPKLAEELV